MQIIERMYGMLEMHSDSQAEVRQAGARHPGGASASRRTSASSRRSVEPGHPQHLRRPRAAHQPHPPRRHDRSGTDALRSGMRAGRLRRAGRQRGGEGGEHQRARGPLLRQLGRVYLGGEERDIDVGWRAAEHGHREHHGRGGRRVPVPDCPLPVLPGNRQRGTARETGGSNGRSTGNDRNAVVRRRWSRPPTRW